MKQLVIRLNYESDMSLAEENEGLQGLGDLDIAELLQGMLQSYITAKIASAEVVEA